MHNFNRVDTSGATPRAVVTFGVIGSLNVVGRTGAPTMANLAFGPVVHPKGIPHKALIALVIKVADLTNEATGQKSLRERLGTVFWFGIPLTGFGGRGSTQEPRARIQSCSVCTNPAASAFKQLASNSGVRRLPKLAEVRKNSMGAVTSFTLGLIRAGGKETHRERHKSVAGSPDDMVVSGRSLPARSRPS